ncbi:GNAT family N-acetyltransferase [Streptomyces sp. SID13031]|uniref:GNAT family N-acetyltransferase n=1 Tax=Streptomyces sp. SID13031 TaxID=2706046 RepID=UPI0013CBF113|nr:GNAT family N-acetyltransferase [Streptomyces sp. SID13031]NEA34544.1 GNAT family N-acetyltransferase [Streptomyces sp. SID13031]
MTNAAGAVRITGNGLILREWQEADLPAMVDLFDNPEVARWTPLASPFDLVAAARYLDSGQADESLLHLAITTDGLRPLGEVLLSFEDQSIGVAISPAVRGQGLALRALNLITAYAHETADLPRVIAEIEPGNTASQSVARRAGYRLTDGEPRKRTSRGREISFHLWEHLA